MKESKTGIFAAFGRIFGWAPSRQRLCLLLLFIGMLIVAVLETVNVGVIALYISYLSNPESTMESKYIALVTGHLPDAWLATPATTTMVLSMIVISTLTVKNVLHALITYYGSRLAAYLEAFFGNMLLAGFLRMPYAWHQTRNSADLVLAVQWSAFFGRVFIDPFLRAMSDVVMVAFLLVSLVIFRPFISLGILVVLGSMALFLFVLIRRRVAHVAARCKARSQAISRHITKAIHGIKDVKVSGKENFFLEDYRIEAHPLARDIGLQQFLARSPVWILELAGFAMLAMTVCVMSFLMKSSTTEITATVALLAITAYRVLPALNKILAGVTKMHTALPYIDGQFAYLNLFAEHIDEPDPDAATGPALLKFEHSIGFEKVCFRYDGADQNALEDVDLTIEKGETIGVIGPSGAGKSTFVDMLIGLLVPTEGEVKVDGRNLEGYSRVQWVKSIGYVAQAPYIYDGTLAENVAFGCRGADIDRDRVLQCCEQAAMAEFMTDLPEGIDTQIGERGIRLSGGQQQRVVIARALYSRPSVMLFDEATSSLDTKSEKAIQNTIYSFKGKQTLVVVAHRLSTVEDCDRLVWLDRGRIRKVGTPMEILHEYQATMHEEERVA